MFEYQFEITKDTNGTFLVTFPHVPEAVTFGATKEEAIHNAQEALETALSFYIEDGRDLPKSSTKIGKPYTFPSVLIMLKLGIYQLMRDKKMRRIDMARLLKIAPIQVDRLVDPTHESKLSQLESAYLVLGQKPKLSFSNYKITGYKTRPSHENREHA